MVVWWWCGSGVMVVAVVWCGVRWDGMGWDSIGWYGERLDAVWWEGEARGGGERLAVVWWEGEARGEVGEVGFGGGW